MIINHNMASLNTYNKLSANNTATSKSLEKLSSGLRINRAGDDAAGLAISEKMRGQIRGLDQASRNAQDATSMLNTAEGNLSETQSILQRMKELATQAANDTNVGVDRNEIQKEINQLTSEINRIGNTTEFNTQKLLNGGGAQATDLTVITTSEGGAKGNISAVQTIAASNTGLSETSIVFANTTPDNVRLTIQAKENGTHLEGFQFQFVGGAGADSVARTGSTITINRTSLATMTSQNLEDAINNSGLVAHEINVTAFNETTGAAIGAAAALDAAALDTRVTSGMTGGEASGTRGVYSFDVTNAFVTDGDTATLRIALAGAPNGYQDITLEAEGGGGTVAGNIAFNIGATAADKLNAAEQANAIKTALAADGTVGAMYDVSVNGSKVVLTEKATAISGTDIQKMSVTSTASQGVMTYTHSDQRVVETGGKFTVDGVDIRVVDGTGADDAADISAGKAIQYTVGDNGAAQAALLRTAITNNTQLNSKYTVAGAGAAVTLTQRAGAESDTPASMVAWDKAGNGFSATFQIGANTAQSMTIQINDMRSQALKISGVTSGASVTASNGSVATLKATKDVTNGTDNTSVEYALDVSDHTKATNAISVLEDAIEAVSAERSKIGAYTNRLEHTVNNLTTSSENLTSAESRIRDVDMAKEMMNFQKNNILSQAAQAMLAQANQQPQGVLQLLR